MSRYFVKFLAIIVFEQFVFAGIGCAGDPVKHFWWSNISYQYDTEREYVTLTPEFETNDLPFDLELYGFIDFTGDHGQHETDLKNHTGSFDLFKPLNTFGIAEDSIVLHMFDMAVEYNTDTFTEDRCYFGFRWRGNRTFGSISKFLNTIDAVFDITVFLARTDGRQGHDWWMISPYLKIPFSIGRVNGFSSTWCDIDFDNPLNEYRRNSISGQSMLAVNIWKQLYAFCEVKYEDFQEPFDDAFGMGFGLMWQWYFEKPGPEKSKRHRLTDASKPTQGWNPKIPVPISPVTAITIP